MGSDFYVRHGGRIRMTAEVASGSGDFNKGSLLELDSSAEWTRGTGGATRVYGVAYENKPSTADGASSGSAFTSVGTPSGNRVSAIMDEVVIETDELASGIVFAVNDRLYSDTAGLWTNVQPGTCPVLGMALSTAVSNAGDVLKLLFSAQYA